MRAHRLLACCVLLVLGLRADADILKMRQGDELRGTLQLVTFLVNDIQTIYPRDEVVSVQLATDAKDVLEARSEAKLEGKLVSVMFEAASGLRAVTRDKIASITLDKATMIDALKAQQKDDTEKAEEQKSQLSDEQKEALTKNRELYKAYADAAEQLKDDAYDAVKTKYMERVREVVNTAQRLDRSIQNKLRRRDQASGRSYTTTVNGRTVTVTDRDRLLQNDGLARDQQDLEKARAAGSKLKSTIRAEEKKVRDKADDRTSRLDAVYTNIRKRILDGETISEDDMTARYDAAIRLPGDKNIKVGPKAAPKTAPKTDKAAADGGGKAKQGLADLKGE